MVSEYVANRRLYDGLPCFYVFKPWMYTGTPPQIIPASMQGEVSVTGRGIYHRHSFEQEACDIP